MIRHKPDHVDETGNSNSNVEIVRNENGYIGVFVGGVEMLWASVERFEKDNVAGGDWIIKVPSLFVRLRELDSSEESSADE